MCESKCVCVCVCVCVILSRKGEREREREREMAYQPPPRAGIADSSSMNEGLLFEDDDDEIDEFGRRTSRKYGIWRRLHSRVGELLDARRVSVFSLLLLVIFALAIALIVESGKAGRPHPSPTPTPTPSPVPPMPDTNSTVSVSVRFDETLHWHLLGDARIRRQR